MSLFNTPPKSATNTSRDHLVPPNEETKAVAGPSGVRKSIGEWEDQSKVKPKPSNKAAVVDATKPKQAAVARRQSTGATGSPPPTTSYPNRAAEAKACLQKAKFLINSSRNLKTDIKDGTISSVDRLYQLFKEAETMRNASSQPKPQQMETGKPELIKEDGILLRKIEESNSLIKENKEKLEKITEYMEKYPEILGVTTYASVVARRAGPAAPERSALHSVVVTSKDETESGEVVLDKIRKVVNAKEGGIKVDKIRKAKDRKVIVSCESEEERRKVKEKISRSGELNVEFIKNKDPLVIFRDLLQHNSDEDVLRALRNQNKSIFNQLEKEDDRMEIAYKRRTRNPHTSHVVMRVSPKLWRHLLAAGAAHIDLQRVRVADQSPLVQCSLCLGYGHGRRFCKETLEKCCHCGGPHIKSKCADWLAGAAPSCCNCVQEKLENTGHNAFSMECAVRRKWEALARSTVAYC